MSKSKVGKPIKLPNSALWNFYRFSQHNSGAKMECDVERGIGVEVYIQAPTAAGANKIAEKIGIYFDGVEKDIDCPCCGDRWYRASENSKVIQSREELEKKVEPIKKFNLENYEEEKMQLFFLHEYDGTITQL